MRNASCMMLAAGLAATLWTPAQAGLADERDLNNRLAVVAAADRIRKGCGSIDARMAVATAFLWETAFAARDRGYSRDEIEAYIDDDDAKAVIEAGAEKYLLEKGGLDEAALCATGQAEIAAKTAIGKLLK